MKLDETWGGYVLAIEDKTIYIHHDSKRHQWSFQENEVGSWYYGGKEFFRISEKKGEAIIKFLHALTKIFSKASNNEEILDKDHDEDFCDEDPDNEEILDNDPDEDFLDMVHDEEILDAAVKEVLP